MHPNLLHVVTCISNPLRWKSRIELYKYFARHMVESGVRLTVVECALGERPFELSGDPLVDFVGVRHSTLTFNKECLLNIGIQDVVRRNPDAQYIAVLDADIRFRNPAWAAETVHALQRFEVVQAWVDCYDLGPNDQHLELHRSFGKIWQDQQPILQGPNAVQGPYRFGHPGYAWAWRRSALAAVGLLPETAVLGAADHHMAMALVGRVTDSIPGSLAAAYAAPLIKWQDRAARLGFNLGSVPGTIEHHFHGSKQKRRYVERWDILQKWNFDPQLDLIKNEYGVVELAGNKPGLRMDIERYFSERDEDANSV
jgi:glycosyltransferase involved in cell wall biosynthesis